jgi:hypothetical protein
MSSYGQRNSAVQMEMLTLSLAFSFAVLLALVAISRVAIKDTGWIATALDANGEILDKMDASMFWLMKRRMAKILAVPEKRNKHELWKKKPAPVGWNKKSQCGHLGARYLFTYS